MENKLENKYDMGPQEEADCILYTCEDCTGSGGWDRSTDCETYDDWQECSTCEGTGTVEA